MPPVYSTSCWKAKFQSLELSNLGPCHWNLVVHMPTRLFPARRLTDGTEGKAVIPFRSILQTASGILQTPLIKDAVLVSLGAQVSAAFPQAKGMEEAKLTAGDSTADRQTGGAIANTPDDTKTPPPCTGRRRVPRSTTGLSSLSADH
jgi:hypothetical protein